MDEQPNNVNEQSNKLLEEWDEDEDSQILWIGIPIALLLLVPIWFGFFNGDDDEEETATATTEEVEEVEEEIEEEEAEEPAAAPETEEEDDGFLPVAPAVAAFPGDIDNERNGNEVTLAGFVGTQDEKDEAEEAVLALDDVDAVNNELVVLQEQALTSLNDSGVANAEVSGEGTVIIARGQIPSEDSREPTITAIEDIEGVTEVTDELTVDALIEVNALPQVEFATGSSQILESSFANLDQAAELITASGLESIDIQGFTDTTGDEAANQQLSEDRANSVRNYLIGQGVDAGVLTATGFGETTQFAEGDSEEALAENRKVLFAEVG